MLDNIKELLDLGLIINSNNYKLNKTNGRAKRGCFEYSLTSNINQEYYYDDETDQSYKEAIQIILQDQKENGR